MVPLQAYLTLAAFIFSCGLYGALARRNAIAMLMAVELMLNAVNINLVAFWRYGPQSGRPGGPDLRHLRDCRGCGRGGGGLGARHRDLPVAQDRLP